MRVRLLVDEWDQLNPAANSPKYIPRRRGEVFDIDDEHARWLCGSGAAELWTPESDIPDPEPDTPDPDTVPEDGPPAEENTGGPPMKRPNKVARKEAWEEYARAAGVDIKGLHNKQEIIGACDSAGK